MFIDDITYIKLGSRDISTVYWMGKEIWPKKYYHVITNIRIIYSDSNYNYLPPWGGSCYAIGDIEVYTLRNNRLRKVLYDQLLIPEEILDTNIYANTSVFRGYIIELAGDDKTVQSSYLYNYVISSDRNVNIRWKFIDPKGKAEDAFANYPVIMGYNRATEIDYAYDNIEVFLEPSIATISAAGGSIRFDPKERTDYYNKSRYTSGYVDTGWIYGGEHTWSIYNNEGATFTTDADNWYWGPYSSTITVEVGANTTEEPKTYTVTMEFPTTRWSGGRFIDYIATCTATIYQEINPAS